MKAKWHLSTILASMILASSCNAAQVTDVSPVGRWINFNDETGARETVIQISETAGQLIGRIVEVFPHPGEPASLLCKKCEGAEKNQPILGMTILKGFRQDGDEWTDGTILDPRSGTVYDANLHVDDDTGKLVLRGYVGIPLLGRTKIWIRAKNEGGTSSKGG